LGCKLPEVIVPDYIDDDEDPECVDNASTQPPAPSTGDCCTDPGRVLLLAEDFGHGVCMPSYGFRRSAADYFQSNLMINLYVMANITTEMHDVFLYDERLQGKDKDALCSLRLAYHIRLRNQCLSEGRDPPEVFISIRDNCVGQNKSNITMKFEQFLTLAGFYKRVLIIYLIPY
jgi:hypothetical protein